MTDNPNIPPGRASVSSRGVRWALIASLAVNLGVAGMALGAFLHGGPGGRDAVHDLGFGPYDQALRPQDRQALKAAMGAKAQDLQASRAEVAQDAAAIIAALRAQPFDPAALQVALSGQQNHLNARMKLGGDALRDFLIGLSPQDRLDFAERLERHLLHGRDMPPPQN
jgi:uncharacterized membrane protein